MRVTFFRDVQTFLKGDVSTSFTVGYLVLIMIGMLFNGLYYSFWGINIFEYSDISDFILAPFRDLFILIFTAASIFAIYALLWFDEKIERRFPRVYKILSMGMSARQSYQNWYSFKGIATLIIFYVVTSAFFYAAYQKKKLLTNGTSKISILTKDNQFSPTDTTLYLGKTNAYIFMYLKNKKQRVIIPSQDIVRISISK